MATYNNPWTFNGQPFESEDIKKNVGYVYIIINKLTNQKYIGRKYFWHMKRPSKAARRKKVESDWKTYYGSSDVLKKDVEKHGENNFQRVILSLHSTKGDVNYTEVKEQFQRNVLEDPTYYNDNIGGKYFKKPEHISGKRLISNERYT